MADTLIPECNENIGKGYFRLGHEVDFRGNKSLYVLSTDIPRVG